MPSLQHHDIGPAVADLFVASKAMTFVLYLGVSAEILHGGVPEPPARSERC